MAEPVDQPDGTPGGDEANDAAHPPLESHTGQPHIHGDLPKLVHDLLLRQNPGHHYCLTLIQGRVKGSE